jgi:excisionase family DNA binding protein
MSLDWITTKEAAALSGYHPKYIRRLILEGKVKAQKWGRDWQVSRSSLMSYVHEVKKLGDKRGPKPGD